ncbi:MAG: hypothetical protein Q8K58_09020 [Acidimicrobiales bacterium]|nr:hypothetical protein [Acidimicrobiales bacterium]
MKKGRHRRFEEARKLKQSGPEFLFSNEPLRTDHADTTTDGDVEPEDDYAALARKYGAFDDDEKAEEEA